jgi:hypothetical protein
VLTRRAQMAAAALLCGGAVRVLRLVPREPLHSARQARKIAALSAVFCASVVAGNVSLRFIPVSFNQAISATDPAFTALFGAVLLRRREARATYAALVPIVVGTALASGVRPRAQLRRAAFWLTQPPRCAHAASSSPASTRSASPCAWAPAARARSRACCRRRSCQTGALAPCADVAPPGAGADARRRQRADALAEPAVAHGAHGAAHAAAPRVVARCE